MNIKAFDGSVIAVVLIIIGILFSACSISRVDPNETTAGTNKITGITTTEPTTSENDSEYNLEDDLEYNSDDDSEYDEYSFSQCMVAPSDEYSIELLGTQDFTPGYLLFQENLKSDYKLLLAKKMKKTDYLAEFKTCVYGVTEENEIVEVSKTDGSYKTVYTAKHGSIDYISNMNCFYRCVYFNDGNYIVELDPITNECTEKLESDKGIYRIFAGGDVIKLNDISFCCDTCLERGDYFIWQDNEDENYYWHHPESGEDELIEDFNNVHNYGSFMENYRDLFIWKFEK